LEGEAGHFKSVVRENEAGLIGTGAAGTDEEAGEPGVQRLGEVDVAEVGRVEAAAQHSDQLHRQALYCYFL